MLISMWFLFSNGAFESHLEICISVQGTRYLSVKKYHSKREVTFLRIKKKSNLVSSYCLTTGQLNHKDRESILSKPGFFKISVNQLCTCHFMWFGSCRTELVFLRALLTWCFIKIITENSLTLVLQPRDNVGLFAPDKTDLMLSQWSTVVSSSV
jgi:hypothetical protein